MEGLWKGVWKEILDFDLPAPFERLPYKMAIEKYGTDKPDLRLPWELATITDIFKHSEFKVFRQASDLNHLIQALKIPKADDGRTT